MSTKLIIKIPFIGKFVEIGRRPFLTGAVIICLSLVFIFWGHLLRTNSMVASLASSFKNKETGENNQVDGYMGGPAIDPIVGESWAATQVPIDFSADDETENVDFSTIQESSVIGSTNPSVLNQFSNIKKEIATYVVKNGDIPEKIAALFGINTKTLLWANNLKDGDLIKPGDHLIILPLNGINHKIQSGDTIASLAKKYQADEEEIKQFNYLSSDADLKVAESIIIPGGEIPVAPKAKPKPKVVLPKFATSLPSLQPTSSWLIQPAIGFNWGRLHSNNGIDVANQCGTPIYAAADGVIILADMVGWNGGYGKNVRVRHPNGVVTLYAHLSESLVEAGQQVAQGQMIALMGTTGRSTGCHVHFEVRGAKNPFTKTKR